MPSPGPRLRRVVALPSLVTAEAGALLALLRLRPLFAPAAPSRRWLSGASHEDLVGAAAWALATLLAAWLLASTVLYAAGRVLPGLQALRAFEWLTVPALRHVVDRALALSLGASALVAVPPSAAPAGAVPASAVSSSSTAPPAAAPATGTVPLAEADRLAPSHPRVRIAADGSFVVEGAGPTTQPTVTAAPLPFPASPDVDEHPVVRAPAPPTASTTTSPTTAPPPSAPDPAPSPPPSEQAGQPSPPTATRRTRLHVVMPGDSLWRIASAEVATARNGEAGESEVAAYWRVLVELNRPSLRSGDPSLIYPGEVLLLPDRPG